MKLFYFLFLGMALAAFVLIVLMLIWPHIGNQVEATDAVLARELILICIMTTLLAIATRPQPRRLVH